MQQIETEITDKYDLDIRNVVPCKDAYIINTSKGKKILKKSILSPGRILFIHGAKEHLYNNSLKNLDRYLCTVEGKPYIVINEDIYTIVDLIEGNECNFDNRQDVINATRLLALLHKASKGYIPPEDSIPRDELGKLPVNFTRRLEEIKKLKKAAKKGKTKFDYLFLEHVDYFLNLGENAIELLAYSRYDDVVKSSRNEGIFCHHDFTHHNIMCGQDGISIVKFDFCCFELKIYDIANFIRRKMRKCYWNVNEARVIISEYRFIERISEDEFSIMKIILQFPQKFWRVANKYYNSKHILSEKTYISKLQEVVDEVAYHKQFMEKFEFLV